MAQIASELVAAPVPRLIGAPALPRWTVVLAGLVILLASGAMAASYLASTGNVATATYQVQRLRAERDTWRMRNDQLRVELQKARSLTWVEHEAVSRLNMHKPASTVYLHLDVNRLQGQVEARPSGPG